MKPLVSVIIPLYNQDQFIVQTLQSVLASRYDNLEVVVVDDGSTDNSLHEAQKIAQIDSRVRVYSQPNAGVCAARNKAISLANGTYILPVDADDLISDDFISLGIDKIEQNPQIKVVGCRAAFIGDRQGEWHLPAFSIKRLAHKNIIPVTAIYRKSDWQKAGGYCEKLDIREDWDFWLSVFASGGEFYKIDKICLYYRIRTNSKRKQDSRRKQQLINSINERHHDFLYSQLGGPLHYQRTWSRLINRFRHEKGAGEWQLLEASFRNSQDIIYQGRNTLKNIDGKIVKSFSRPSFAKAIIYGLFHKSKAQRSYEYATRLGDMTPKPIGYMDVRYCGLLLDSYYACEKSECQYTFNDLIGNPDFPNREHILSEIGRFIAGLHKQGVLHQDLSGGNILFNADGSKIEIIDLNRIHWERQSVGYEQGCTNFERLNIDKQALRTMAYSYAQTMGYEQEKCAQYIITHRWEKHIKQGITNL